MLDLGHNLMNTSNFIDICGLVQMHPAQLLSGIALIVTSPLSLQRDSFITPDIKDFFSSPNAELCLSPTKIYGFPHSGIL